MLDNSDGESSLDANGKGVVTDDNTSMSLPDDLSTNEDSNRSDEPPAKKPKPDSK